MSQNSDQKPAHVPKNETKSNQPTLTELSPEQLDKVSGGQKVSMGEIHFTHPTDKATP